MNRRPWAVEDVVATPETLVSARAKVIREFKRDHPGMKYIVREWHDAATREFRGVVEELSLSPSPTVPPLPFGQSPVSSPVTG